MDLHTENSDVARYITTQRLVLRPLRGSDLEWVRRVAGDYEVSKMLVPVPHPYSAADAEEFFRMAQEGALGIVWVITLAETPVGVIGSDSEIGYWSDPTVWGQGIMTEAARAVVSAWFKGTRDQVLFSSHFVENTASRRVLEKVGFVDVGPHEHFSKARNAMVDGRSMELTRSRWEQLNG